MAVACSRGRHRRTPGTPTAPHARTRTTATTSPRHLPRAPRAPPDLRPALRTLNAAASRGVAPVPDRAAWQGGTHGPLAEATAPCPATRGGRLQPRRAKPSGTTARGRGAGSTRRRPTPRGGDGVCRHETRAVRPLPRPGPWTAARPRHTVRTRGDGPPLGEARRTVGDTRGRQTRWHLCCVVTREGKAPERSPLLRSATGGATGVGGSGGGATSYGARPALRA